MWKFEAPTCADLVLSDDCFEFHRKSGDGWNGLFSTRELREGVHTLRIYLPSKCYLAVGFRPKESPEWIRIFPLDGFHGVQYFRYGDLGVARSGEIVDEGVESLKMERAGIIIEFKVDMSLRTLSARKASLSGAPSCAEWNCVSEKLPDVVRFWAGLGSKNKAIRLEESNGGPSVLQAGLTEDLLALYESGVMSDVNVIIGGLRQSAHSMILAARSKVFAAMLQAPMKEAITKEIVLEDLPPCIAQPFLRFLYGAEVPKDILQDHACAAPLLQAAHRYEVPTLEKSCAEALGKSLQVETVAEVLLEADSLNCADLRRRCFEYVAANIADVQGTEGFKRLAERRPSLMLEVVAEIAPPSQKRRKKT